MGVEPSLEVYFVFLTYLANMQQYNEKFAIESDNVDRKIIKRALILWFFKSCRRMI